MWCEIVEGASPRFLPTAPTHSRISASVLHVPPGKQHEARRVKMLKRCGFDSALNASASCPESAFRKFDMYRIIIKSIEVCQVRLSFRFNAVIMSILDLRYLPRKVFAGSREIH